MPEIAFLERVLDPTAAAKERSTSSIFVGTVAVAPIEIVDVASIWLTSKALWRVWRTRGGNGRPRAQVTGADGAPGPRTNAARSQRFPLRVRPTSGGPRSWSGWTRSRGFSRRVAEVVVAEIAPDRGAFPSARHWRAGPRCARAITRARPSPDPDSM